VDRDLEIELALRLLAGEEGAFERFVEHFRAKRDPERVRPWVFRIAKDVCLTKRRKSIFAPTPAQEISLDELMPTRDSRDGSMKLEIADWSNVPEDRLLRTELGNRAQRPEGRLTIEGLTICRVWSESHGRTNVISGENYETDR